MCAAAGRLAVVDVVDLERVVRSDEHRLLGHVPERLAGDDGRDAESNHAAQILVRYLGAAKVQRKREKVAAVLVDVKVKALTDQEAREAGFADVRPELGRCLVPKRTQTALEQPMQGEHEHGKVEAHREAFVDDVGGDGTTRMSPGIVAAELAVGDLISHAVEWNTEDARGQRQGKVHRQVELHLALARVQRQGPKIEDSRDSIQQE